MTTTYTHNCGAEFNVEYSPGHDAPHCLDRDSPKFSDPGCASEVELPFEKCPGCGERLDEEDVIEWIEGKL